MRVKCLAQEHNTITWPGLEPEPLDPESSALTTRPLRLPHQLLGCFCTKSAHFFSLTSQEPLVTLSLIIMVGHLPPKIRRMTSTLTETVPLRFTEPGGISGVTKLI